jgi:YebC/PmpR family DNA-binding regulatory protein
MSGHSHYATTKRQKELKDNARGQVFSKMARAITIAAKTGGGAAPDSNFKLRIAIDKARAISMPKDIIDRAISKASAAGEALEEVMYEGFGPGGVSVLVEVATDNRNRTASEVRNLFEKNGGKVAVPGAVSFNFEPKGLILIKKDADPDSQMLKLIDLGAADVEDSEDGVEVYVDPKSLSEMQNKLEENGFEVLSSELIQKPKNLQEIKGDQMEKVENFLNNMDEHDDVQKVFTNADFIE